ncbi:MAG: response regulator [Bacteroidaceae bacterium]|nr:response regulator [Bacteroidaceae bacterium]
MVIELSNGTLFQVSVWAVLFATLLVLVCAYVLCRLVARRERSKHSVEMARVEHEHRQTLEVVKQQTLARVSQDLRAPIMLLIGSLQQMAEEPLGDDVGGRVQMMLRSAQMLLHQVNILSAGMGAVPAPSALTSVAGVQRGTVATPARETSSGTPTTSTETAQLVGIDDHNAAMVSSKEMEAYQEEEETNEGQRMTLLMVDDSADMCRFVRDYFRKDYNVITASNGEQALTCLEENDGIGLVVSDVTMPKMDGLELCRRVKTDLRWSHIPVILLTGRRSEEIEVEGLKLGADDYITKPFNVETLRLRVKKLIEKKESRQRQFREKMDVAPSEITITSVDEQFIQQAIKICEEHISDTEFSVEVLGHELSLSRTYLYKKLINITGKGPAEFIRTIRMKRGKQYLEKTGMSMSDIAAALGYSNPKRFTENFKTEYGMSPSEYARKIRSEKTPLTV